MNIYREQLLDHYKNPRNFQKKIDADVIMEVENISCGDRISFQLRLSDNRIKDVSFDGEGCAIAIASASILGESIIGESIYKTRNLTENDLIKLLGVELTPSRLKCALLSLSAVKKALKNID